jgi:hypothetical protein
MLPWLYTYIASFCSQCFIYFFLDVCYKCVYLEVAYVSHLCCSVLSGCCVYFTMAFKCFLYVFASVSDACFKYFIYLQTYVASVASACFKSRPDVVSPSSFSATLPQCLLLLVPTRCPLSLFSMLVMFRAARAPRGRAKWRGKTTAGAEVRALASP